MAGLMEHHTQISRGCQWICSIYSFRSQVVLEAYEKLFSTNQIVVNDWLSKHCHGGLVIDKIQLFNYKNCFDRVRLKFPGIIPKKGEKSHHTQNPFNNARRKLKL